MVLLKVVLSISREAVKAAGAVNFTHRFHDEFMTAKVLENCGQKYQAFDDAFHWLMIDKAREFYSFLYEFIYTGTQT